MAASEAITPSPGTMRLRLATISARRLSTASSNSGIKTGIEPLRRFSVVIIAGKGRPYRAMPPQGEPRGRSAILAVDTRRFGRLNGCGANFGPHGARPAPQAKGRLFDDEDVDRDRRVDRCIGLYGVGARRRQGRDFVPQMPALPFHRRR